jgi:phage terminase large subunit
MIFCKTTAFVKLLLLTKRIRIIQGGTSASKTISILLYLIDKAQSDTTPTLTSVVSESIPHLKRGCVRDFINILQAHKYWKDAYWNSTDSIYTFETGSKIEFFSADNADKLRGGRRDRLFLNEANNMTFDAFEQLEVRTKDLVFIDYNPTSEFWALTKVNGKRDDAEMIILTYQDNEALSQEIINSIEQRKGRKGWWQVYGLGQLGEVEGKIYTGWQIVDEIPHEARLERYGVDFGYTNDPTAIVAVYYYNGGYIVDEIAYKFGMNNKDIADVLINQPKALVIADSAEPKSIDEVASYGLTVIGAVKGKYSVRYNIEVVQEQQMSVTRRSVNVIKEYRNYLWIIDRDGKNTNIPEDEYKHAMDAIAYAMVSIAPMKRKLEQNRVLARKEKLETLKQFDHYRKRGLVPRHL